jgi:hypothetical protein
MTRELAEEQRWPTGRWGGLIVLVLAVQLGLIYWLGKPHPLPPPTTDLPPSVSLSVSGAADVLALNDPTLFALPHRESFSGPAWLSIVEPQPPSVVTEAVPWLSLPQDQLGDELQEYMATNRPADEPLFGKSDFRFKQPLVANTQPLSTTSSLRLTGDLVRRRLLNPPTLPSWPSADILTNTIVEVLVAADGKPLPAVLHVPASGSVEADRYALREVRRARFEPLPVANPADPLEGVTWGQFVFEWQTVPLPATNNISLPGGER